MSFTRFGNFGICSIKKNLESLQFTRNDKRDECHTEYVYTVIVHLNRNDLISFVK